MTNITNTIRSYNKRHKLHLYCFSLVFDGIKVLFGVLIYLHIYLISLTKNISYVTKQNSCIKSGFLITKLRIF